MRRKLATTLAIGITMAAGPSAAHHSFALFDMQKKITITGTIKEFQWLNPHSWILVNVKDTTGKERTWHIEAGAVTFLTRAGWKRDSLKAGDKVVVEINPLRDGRVGGNLQNISANGKPVGKGALPPQPGQPGAY